MFDSVNIDELDDESSFDRQSVVAPSCHADALQIHRQSRNTWDHELWGLKSDFKSSHNWCMTCRPVPMFSLWPVPEYSFTETFSAFCLVPRQRTSAHVPIVNRLVDSAFEGFASLLIKPEVVSTHVNAQVWLFADECDQSATELICLSWTWLFFFHYRWLWQRSVCGSSRKASTASDTQRSSKILVNLIHVVHFGNLWNNDAYTYYIILLCMNHIHSRQPYSWCADSLVNWWWLLHGLAGYTFRLLHATSKRSHDSYVFG